MRIDNPARVPWWLWPNVLNLDAPIITAIWQELFARSAGVGVSIGERAALFLAVWIIYAADRLLDGIRLNVGEEAALRHRFSRRHARGLAVTLLVAIFAEAALVLWVVPSSLRTAGLGLGAVVAVYFLWNHLAGARWGRGWLKEVVVSVVFALGAALVPLIERPGLALGWDVAAFAFACLANCLLIARLEFDRDVGRGEISIAAKFSRDARPARWLSLALIVALAAVFLCGGATPARLGALMAAALIAASAGIERRFGEEAAAAWADAALALGGLAGIVASL